MSGRKWIPFSNNYPPTSATRLATVGRCLRLYSDFLLQTPLKAQNDHYLIKLLDSPNRWQDKKNFYETLVFELLINGNFMAKVDYDSTGRVTALLPFRAGQCYCHPSKGEYSDPLSIQRSGFYYRDFKGRIWAESEIWHLKDSMFNNSDQLNGLSRIYLYELLFKAGYSVQAVQQALSASGLRPSWLLTALDGESADNFDKARDVVGKYFSSGRSATPGGVLTLPTGFDLKQLTLANPEKTLEFLATKSDLDVARIFGVPIELLSRSDGESLGSKGAQTESHRFFIKSSIQPWLKGIADSLSALAMDGTQFKFEIDKFKASNLNEQGQYLMNLVNAGIISKEDAKAMI